MALKQNIIYIYFKGKHQVTSKSQYQYNHGQFLYFADLDLPQAFEVHFSSRDRGESKTQIGSDKLVEIPDEYFWNGALQIYAWIYLHSQVNDGETVYEVKIPLIKRAKPTDEEPLPQQESAMERAIAELNNAVEITTENANKTEEDKTQVGNIRDEVVDLKENIDATAETVAQKSQEAIDASRRSEASAQNAAEFEDGARRYSEDAGQSAQEALESKNIAKQKAQVANDASAEAKDFRDEAETFKNEAEQARQNIVDYRDETKGYRDETLTAKDDAQTIKDDIQSLKTQIDDTADNVFENAREAYQSMISADNASLSASESAENASQSANEANQSATNASESASQAEEFKNQSEEYKTQAEAFKSQTETLKTQAEEFKNQTETNVTHYPKIIGEYWYVWDATNGEYINTNVDANGIKGDTGRGIASIALNNDYTLTITFTDDTTYTTSSIRGQQGEKGDTGKTGESGVYIGAEEPTNEDIKVWIDTDEEGFDVYESINKLNNDVADLNEKISILANRGNSWKEIRQNVKMGYGETLYPVGTDFEVECTENSPYQSIVFTVVDHSVIDDEPCMTLLMKNCINGLQFEHEQALIVPTETLVAGTYHFNFPNNYDASHDGAKTVQFTLVNDVQANDQIMIQYPSNQSWIGKNLTVYSNFTNTVLETCVMSEGEGGIDLGIADDSGIINHITRARYGANNWKESAMRQWLNTDVLVNEWQTQQNRYQRPCTYLTKQNGFMSWFNSDFIGVIKETNHLNRTNRVYDSLGVKTPYSTDDKFFLLSQEEVGFNSEDNIICGTCFDYYNGAENIDRIKYDISNGTTARWWWLRTPTPSFAHYERVVYNGGSLLSNSGYGGLAVASACTI